MPGSSAKPKNALAVLTRGVALLGLVAWLGTAPAFGQTSDDATRDQPMLEGPGALTIDAETQRLSGRVAELEAIDQPTDDDAGELAVLRKALGFLGQAAASREQARLLQGRLLSAPKLLEDIERELALPIPVPVVDVPVDATLDWLSDQLNDAQDRAATVRDRRAALANAEVARLERVTQIEVEQETARTRLSEIGPAIAAPPAQDTPPPIATANRTMLRCERAALESRLTALELEARTATELRGLYRAQRQLVERQILEAEAELTVWNERIAPAIRQQASRAASEAERAQTRAETEHPAVQEVAAETARLAGLASAVTTRLNETNLQFDVIDRQMTGIESQFSNARQRVETVGRTGRLGPVLRDLQRKLPGLKEHRRAIAQREALITKMQVDRLDAEQHLFDLVDVEAKIDDLLDRHPGASEPSIEEILGGSDADTDIDPLYLREILRGRLIRQRDQQLTDLIDQYDRCLERLTLLQQREQELVASVEEFLTFIEERVLWVRSTEPLHRADFDQTFAALRWLFDPAQLRLDFEVLRADVEASPLPTILAVLMLLILVLLQPVARRRLRATSPEHEGRESVGHLLITTVYTIVLSSAAPAAVWYVGWRLGQSAANLDVTSDMETAGVHAAAIGAGLIAVASRLFMLELVRHICRRGGLAHSFFHWPTSSVRTIRRNVTWVLLILLPLSFIVVALHTAGNDLHENSLGRLAFNASMIALAIFFLRIFRPRRGVLGNYLRHDETGWASRLCWLWFGFIVALPLLLVALSSFGYFYTAVRLDERVFRSAWFVWWLLVVNSFLLRLLYLVHEAAAERRATSADALPAPAASVETFESGVETPDESWEHYLSDIHSHVGRLLRSAVGWTLLIGLWFIWADLLPAFTRLEEVVLWTQTTGTGVEAVTLANLALALIILVASIILSMNIPGILEIAVLQHLPLQTGARYATSRVVRYILSVVGIVLAFNAIGIGWSTVQWLVAAITVGLGFGLQEIFANFISGLIILFEQPVRIGDFLTVGNTSGTVTRIQIRATTIRTPDRRELIIPNKAFVTGQIINWSLTSPTVRLPVPVGVQYGSDTQLVVKTLMEVAGAHDRVLSDPAPEVLFMGFGDSALKFELRTYVPSWECRLTIRHDLLMAIDQAFREAGIVIAYPQTDIHIKSIESDQPPLDESRGPLPEEAEADPAGADGAPKPPGLAAALLARSRKGRREIPDDPNADDRTSVPTEDGPAGNSPPAGTTIDEETTAPERE